MNFVFNIVIQLSLLLCLSETVHSLLPMPMISRRQADSRYDAVLRRILEVQQVVHDAIAKKTGSPKTRREAADHNPDAAMVERELNAAVHDLRPASWGAGHIDMHGTNDFLVLKEESIDPFVTVIPNDVFYNNVEKPCVNWLDACSLKGLRDALLHRDNSPYK